MKLEDCNPSIQILKQGEKIDAARGSNLIDKFDKPVLKDLPNSSITKQFYWQQPWTFQKDRDQDLRTMVRKLKKPELINQNSDSLKELHKARFKLSLMPKSNIDIALISAVGFH